MEDRLEREEERSIKSSDIKVLLRSCQNFLNPRRKGRSSEQLGKNLWILKKERNIKDAGAGAGLEGQLSRQGIN